MYPIYAVAMVFVILGIKRLLDFILREHIEGTVLLWALVLGIMTYGGFKNCTWPTLYLSSETLLEKAATFENVTCLYVYERGNSWKVGCNYLEVKNYKQVAFFEDNVDALSTMYDLCKEDEFVLYIIGHDAESTISQIMKYCPQINAYDKLGSFGYATSYHLYGKDIVAERGYLTNFDRTLYLGCQEDGNLYTSETEELLMTLQPKGADYYNLYIQNTVMDLDHGVLAEGQNIQKFEPNGTDAQKWKLVENDDGSVTIYTYNSTEYCLTYDDARNVCLGKYNPEDARQKWWFQKR